MTLIGVGSWLCLLAPLAGALLLTLAGNALPRPWAGILGTAATAVAFVGAVMCFVGLEGKSADDRTQVVTAWTWLSSGWASRCRSGS